MVLKTANEAVVESTGCVLDQHAAPQRNLSQNKYAQEAFVTCCEIYTQPVCCTDSQLRLCETARDMRETAVSRWG
eukprot:5945379-Prymnesium_polylepis.1